MSSFLRYLLLLLMTTVFFSGAAHAHLMVAQRGTLKLGKGGYFFVLSLPVSAIPGIDDDGDGLLSAKELRTHNQRIQQAVHEGFVLTSQKNGPRKIEGLLLNMAHSHGPYQKPASHVIALGRFAVSPEDHDLVLQTTLFGKKNNEQRFAITVTRGQQKYKLQLSKEHSRQSLFTKP